MALNMPRSDASDKATIEQIFWLMFNPPAGKIPNYDNPPSLAPLSFGLFPLLAAISITSVALRIWHNLSIARKLKTDDYLIIAGVTFATAQVLLDLTGTRFARHSWDIKIEWLNDAYLKKLFSQQMVAWVSLLCTKLSILFLYLRIFEVNKVMKIAIILGMVWSALTYVPFAVLTPLKCAPRIGEKWGKVAVRCGDMTSVDFFVVSAVMAVILDVYILVLPLPLVKHLSLSRKRKIGLAAVFLTALFALACAILNLVYRVKFIHEKDIFWMTWELIITAVVENNVAITIACVPAITGLFKSCVSGRKNKRTQLLESTSSKWTTRTSHRISHSRSRGHVALKSIGGTPWDLETGSERDYHMYSTTHLSGWKESKNGKLFTEVSNIPEIPEKSRLRQQHGITKVVGFEQRSSRGTIEEMELSKI